MADITNIDAHRSGQAQVALHGRSINVVHCLQIPLHEDVLLLPNAAVAEIIAYQDPRAENDAPDWFLGRLNWRERQVPLMSFEAASGGRITADKKGVRIAVLNTLNRNPRVPYIGIITQGIPNLNLVNEKDISVDDNAVTLRQSVAAYLKVKGESVLVPDLDDLEDRIERLHSV